MRNKVDIVNRSAELADDDVLELVHAVMHDYRSLQYRALRDGPHDITHMDSKVLAFFGRHPGATQSDLAQHSGRDKAQLARLIKGLREQGLLDGVADAADRRNLRLTLTVDVGGIEEVDAGIERAPHNTIHVALLQALHCDQGQGFYFAPALPAAEAERLIAEPSWASKRAA